ncbi:MAG: HEPN domain-containing protein [Lentisphaerae bacterium]|nr:HEPN domain-containing protein [Lentisphaerota bacterium]
MPPDVKAGSPEDWLRHAKADLALAAVPLPEEGLYSTLCFHAQQAAEKSIKAVLVFRRVEFPKVHSLTRLIDLLPGDIIRTSVLHESARLAVYATAFRYPGERDEPDISGSKYQEALRLAAAVVQWASAIIGNAIAP